MILLVAPMVLLLHASTSLITQALQQVQPSDFFLLPVYDDLTYEASDFGEFGYGSFRK